MRVAVGFVCCGVVGAIILVAALCQKPEHVHSLQELTGRSSTKHRHQVAPGKPRYGVDALTLQRRVVLTQNVVDILQLLQGCPEWGELEFEERPITDKEFLEKLKPVAAFPIQDIRTAIASFESEPDLATRLKKIGSGNLLVLNRMVFDVPDECIEDLARFHSWWSWLSDGKAGLSALWPLGLTEDGRLYLVTRGSSYYGPPYNALGEFDYFRARFGVRRSMLSIATAKSRQQEK